MDYVTTTFDDDSSSHFDFRAQTHTNKLTKATPTSNHVVATTRVDM